MTRHRNFVPAVCAVVFVVWVNGWLPIALALCGAGYLCWSAHKRLEERRAADAATAARADWEHAATLRGDERGVYGQGWRQRQEYEQASR